MANSVDAETPPKKYVMRSKQLASNLSTRTVVEPGCVFESPQRENPGDERPVFGAAGDDRRQVIGEKAYDEKEKTKTEG